MPALTGILQLGDPVATGDALLELVVHLGFPALGQLAVCHQRLELALDAGRYRAFERGHGQTLGCSQTGDSLPAF